MTDQIALCPKSVALDDVPHLKGSSEDVIYVLFLITYYVSNLKARIKCIETTTVFCTDLCFSFSFLAVAILEHTNGRKV